MDAYDLAMVDGSEDHAAYHAMRRSVLFGGSSDYVVDQEDETKPENLALLLKHMGKPTGTVRLDTTSEGKAIVRLVAIARDVQGKGHGAVLMRLLENMAIRHGFRELFIYSAPDAVGFYRKCGYAPFTFDPGNSRGVQLHKVLAQETRAFDSLPGTGKP